MRIRKTQGYAIASQKLHSQALKGFLTICVFFFASAAALSQEKFQIHAIQFEPAVAVESQQLVVSVVGINIAAFDGYSIENAGAPVIFAPENSYEVTVDDNQVVIFYDGPGLCTSPRKDLPDNPKPQIRKFVVPGLPAGEYTLNLEYSIGCGSRFTLASTPFIVYESEFERLHFLEAPKENAVVSGVSVIRGWACHAKDNHKPFEGPRIGTIGYKIDDGEVISMAYPTVRTDTEELCGQGNNLTGFGAVDYWGKYGEGEHSITLMIDGEPVETRSFTVTATRGGFLKGIEADYLLQGFPVPGQSVGIEWSEADQNFIIVESN